MRRLQECEQALSLDAGRHRNTLIHSTPCAANMVKVRDRLAANVWKLVDVRADARRANSEPTPVVPTAFRTGNPYALIGIPLCLFRAR
jgi:hypothetical protein